MAKQSHIQHLSDGGWKIFKTNSKGVEETKDTVPDVIPMGEMESIQVFQHLVSKETDARRASLSMLAHIWIFGTSTEAKLSLHKYVGKGDKKSGQLSPALKDEFRTAEDLYFNQFVNDAHPMHKAYMAQLPKMNERSEELPEEERHKYFVGRTRKSPSYANAKNLFLNYVAFVGHTPFTQDEESGEVIGLEPGEVMRERIADAKKDVPGPDRSWEKRMQDLIGEYMNPENPEKPLTLDGNRLPGLLQDLRLLTQKLQAALKHHEKMQAELKAKGVNVPVAGANLIEKAQNKTPTPSLPKNPQTEKVETVK